MVSSNSILQVYSIAALNFPFFGCLLFKGSPISCTIISFIYFSFRLAPPFSSSKSRSNLSSCSFWLTSLQRWIVGLSFYQMIICPLLTINPPIYFMALLWKLLFYDCYFSHSYLNDCYLLYNAWCWVLTSWWTILLKTLIIAFELKSLKID